MATTHFWHQLHLYRPQVSRRTRLAGLAGLLLISQAALAQQSRASRGKGGAVKSITVNNLSNYDDRWFHPGFYIAPNYSRYKLQHSRTYVQNRNVSANAIISPGLSVGFVGDVRLADYFNFRFAPGVSFMTRRVEFKPKGYQPADSIKTQEVGTTQIDFPFLIKMKSQRRRNTRVYVVGGLKPSLNVGNRRKDPTTSQLRAADTDLAIEYGVGLDLFYPLFKFAPELRFSNGLTNLLQPTSDIYGRSLQSLRSNTVTLYLTFE